ncbi:MAG: uracil-xanthine permease, partial [Oscillospiraceae bacterium]|nr:uracil-xanthine permease [Oscillospiraceae bacterium]
ISAVGVRNIVENRIDMTKSRNLIIAAVVLVSGLGFQSYPITIALGEATLSFGGLACAAILGILLNAILPGKDEIKSDSEDEHKDVPLMELGAELPEDSKVK